MSLSSRDLPATFRGRLKRKPDSYTPWNNKVLSFVARGKIIKQGLRKTMGKLRSWNDKS